VFEIIFNAVLFGRRIKKELLDWGKNPKYPHFVAPIQFFNFSIRSGI
jgi:hypothetical protein